MANTAATKDDGDLASVSDKPSHPDVLLPDYLFPAVPVRETGRTPTPSPPVSANLSHPDRLDAEPDAPEIRECPHCQETCLNTQVLTRHIEIFHDPSMITAPQIQTLSNHSLFSS